MSAYLVLLPCLLLGASLPKNALAGNYFGELHAHGSPEWRSEHQNYGFGGSVWRGGAKRLASFATHREANVSALPNVAEDLQQGQALFSYIHAQHHNVSDALRMVESLWDATQRASVLRSSLAKEQESLHQHLPEARSLAGSGTQPHAFRVTSFGADPSGRRDSTRALQAAINRACSAPRTSGNNQLERLADLGGVEIDLEGGKYAISRPLVVPQNRRGLKIHGGSIRALPRFPRGQYLLSLSPSSPSIPCCSFERITLADLNLAGGYIANGLRLRNCLRVVVDNVYVLQFSQYGIRIQGGHEVVVRNSFVGQRRTVGGNPLEKSFSGTGISLEGNDHILTDVSVFSAAVGVSVTATGNTLTGVHAYNKAALFGGVGIYVAGTNRILGSYIDYNTIVVVSPTLVAISNCFFYGGGYIILRAVPRRPDGSTIQGVLIRNNMFFGLDSGPLKNNVVIDQTKGIFHTVRDMSVEQNSCKGRISCVGTRASARVLGVKKRVWVADFSSRLMFPNSIGNVQTTFQTLHGFPQSVVRSYSNNRIVVETATPVTGSLFVVVTANSAGQ